MARRSTITDVAERARTSVATVSRHLSNNGYPVSEDAKKRIDEAVRRLDYSPNMVGRMLKKSLGMDIGVIIPTIMNPYYPAVVLGIEEEALRRGYGIFLCNSQRNPKNEKNYMDSLIQKQVGGIIISSSGKNRAHYEKLNKLGVPVVSLDGDIPCRGFGKILFDYEQGAYLAGRHLVELGHTDIAFLTAPLTKKSRIEMQAGFVRAVGSMARTVVSEDEKEHVDGTYEFNNGTRLAEMFLKLSPRPSAILAVNDMTAYGIIRRLNENGLRVPEDVSVVGFDDIEFSRMFSPPLTTVSQPSFRTGKLAARLLFSMLEGNKEETHTLEPILVVRGSTMKKEDQNGKAN
ncbi:MAG: LacI family DNA-binding transcriptional regulator [Clostridia bacterium]